MKIEACTKILSGYAFKAELFNDNGDGIPLVRIRDVGRDYSATYYPGTYSQEYIIDNGDILIGMDGDFRISEWKGGRALLNQRVCKIIANEELISTRFMLYILPKELKKIEDATSFATVKHLSVSKIKEIEIPLPPLPTQQKIAAILDAADAFRQKTKAIIEKYEMLAQSLFLEMFGDPVRNEKGWETCTIRDLIVEAKYGTSSKSSENGEYPYLRMNNISYLGYIDYSDLKYIDIPDGDKSKYIVKKGDVLFNRTNSKELVGKTGIVEIDDEMIIAGYLIRVRVNEFANPYYLWAHLNSKWAKLTLNNMCKNIVGMANINAQELQDIKILKAPISLQNQFAVHIQLINQQKQQAQASLAKAEALFNSLLQRAFKGELVS